MELEQAKAYARREALHFGVNQYVYQSRIGNFEVTDTRAFYRDEQYVGWVTPDGQWHAL